MRHWSGKLPTVRLSDIQNSVLVSLGLSDSATNADIAASLLGINVNSFFPPVLSAEERASLKREAPQHSTLGPGRLVSAAKSLGTKEKLTSGAKGGAAKLAAVKSGGKNAGGEGGKGAAKGTKRAANAATPAWKKAKVAGKKPVGAAKGAAKGAAAATGEKKGEAAAATKKAKTKKKKTKKNN